MEKNNNFDFLITDEGDVMLIMETKNGEINNPKVKLFPEQHKIVMKRNTYDECTFNDVNDLIFAELNEEEKLLVCEIKQTNTPDEVEIIRSYYTEITR